MKNVPPRFEREPQGRFCFSRRLSRLSTAAGNRGYDRDGRVSPKRFSTRGMAD